MENTKISTGFEQLDNILNGGFNKTDLIILGARPAMGKSALALNITQNISQNINKAVAIFSLEMSKEKVIQRLILQNKAEKNLNKILTLPIYINDNADNTIDKIITECNKLKLSKNNLSLIVIDFLELLSQMPQIKTITNKLKLLALELDTPILCLSQLPRTIDERNNKRPELKDLQNNETILADVDTILLLYRDSYYYSSREESKDIAEIIVFQKHNYNKPSVAKLSFDNSIGKFENFNDKKGDKITTKNNSIQTSKLCASMKNRTVGIISIAIKENSPPLDKLIHDIKSLGLSYNEFIGYSQEDKQTTPTLEESLIIYTDNNKDWLKKRLAKLANKYNQDKFLIIDKENIVYLISCSAMNLEKPVINELNLGPFQVTKLPDIYSMMGKNNYVFERMRATSLCSAYLHKVTREKSDEK